MAYTRIMPCCFGVRLWSLDIEKEDMSWVRNYLPSRRCFHSKSIHERADEDVS